MNTTHILIVEDSTVLRDLYVRLFTWEHFKVEGAATLTEAFVKLNALKDKKLVILTDHRLNPDVSDLLIVKAAMLKIPIFGMSGEDTILQHMIDLGCIDAFHKPFIFDDLVNAIRAI